MATFVKHLSVELEKRDLLNCTICFLPFNETRNKPRLLNCHHTFCQNCLEIMLTKNNVLTCPLCCQKTLLPKGNNIESLQTNTYITSFAEMLQTFHNISFQENDVPSTSICPRHHTAMFFWCYTCNVQACVHCLGLSHSPANEKHKISELSEVLPSLQQQVFDNLGKVKSISEEAKKAYLNLTSTHNPSIGKAMLALENASNQHLQGLLSSDLSSLDVIESKIQKIVDLTEAPLFENASLVYETNQKLTSLLKVLTYLCHLWKQKGQESEALRSSSIMVSMVRSELTFDFGRIYCIRCGTMCDFPRFLKANASGNPYKVATRENLCKKCGIAILEFS